MKGRRSTRMKKIKKTLIVILTVCLCAMCFEPIVIYADETQVDIQTEQESVWDGSAKEEVVPLSDNYTIDTAPKLAWFAQQVNSGNSFDGKTVLITGNINLNNKYWTPIGKGTGASNIAGTIKIEDCTIKGLNSCNLYSGLFGNVKVRQFTIDNFRLENSQSSNSNWDSYVGALFGRVEVAANGSFSILNSYFSGTSSNHQSFSGPTGGIVGSLVIGDSSNISIENVETHFQCNAGAQIGSLFAEVIDNTSTGQIHISKVNTNDNLTGYTNYGYHCTNVGGLIGSMSIGSIYLDRIVVNGKISSSGYCGYAGGIIANANYKVLQAENIAIKSEIYSSWRGVYGYVENAGGFLGYSGTTDPENSYIRNSYVVGKINDGVAFCSHCQSSSKTVRIENCYFDKDTTTVPANKLMCTGYADLFGISDVNSKALNTTAMKQKESYNEWDFDHVWDIAENEYPALRWLSNTENSSTDDKDDLTETEKQEFAQTHIDYVNSDAYQSLVYNYSLQFQNKVFDDSGKFKDYCMTWKAVRFDIFDNPYKIVLADMILSEESAYSQEEAFKLNLYSNQRTIVNGIMGLINEDGRLSFSDKLKIEKLFTEKDFYDTATYELCEKYLQKYINSEDLNNIFKGYDKTNTFMGILKNGTDVVNCVINTVNYCSVLQAYSDTSKEFRDVLVKMYVQCTYETDYSYGDILLGEALFDYLKISDETDIQEEIAKKAAGEYLETGWGIFKDVIVNKTKNYLLDAIKLDASLASAQVQAALGEVNAVISGLKIGYKVGVAFDNIFFNTDKVVDSYINAYAVAKTATHLREALLYFEDDLLKKNDFESANMFCQAFRMYKNIQLDIVDKLVKFYRENDKGFISWLHSIFFVQDSEAPIYLLLRDKINWQLASCHDAESKIVKKVKNMTISCPVDVEIRDSQNNIVLLIEGNQVKQQSDNAVATVRNNIKYITVDDAQNYDVKISATDNGVMQYQVTSCDDNGDTQNTIKFENISLNKGQIFLGQVQSGNDLSEESYALSSNGNQIESNCKIYNNSNKVDITDIVLNASSLKMQVGDKKQVSSNILPIDASDKNITWYSEDASVATVDEYGNITAIKKGSTNIICETLNGAVSKICSVTVKAAQSTSSDDNTSGSESTSVITGGGSSSSNSGENSKPDSDEKTDISEDFGNKIDDPVTVTLPEKGTLLVDSKTKMVYKVTKSAKAGGTVQFVKTDNTKAKTIIIPATVTINGITYKVTSIAANACKNNRMVTTVTIGKYVTSIGSGAFSGCTKLRKVTIGKRVTTIGSKAFYKCTNLTSIVLPSKVVKIENYAFKGCSKLNSIKISTKLLTSKTVSAKAFSGISTKVVIKVPKEKLKTYQKLLAKKGLNKKVTVK